MEKPNNWPITLPLNNCLKCTLYKQNSYHPYNATGNLVNPKIIIVGEAPGSAEEATGRVFQGRAGQLMRKALGEVGINPEVDCLITNVVMCRPLDATGDNRKPEKAEIANCHENLEAILNYYKTIAKLIVPMGATPLKRVSSKGSITNARGTLTDCSYGKMIPSYHPAYILRNMNLLPIMRADFRFVSDFVGGIEQEEVKGGEYIIINNMELLKWAFERLSEVEQFVFDIESTGLEFWEQKIIGISFSWRRGTGIYLPLWVREAEGVADGFTDQPARDEFNLKPYWPGIMDKIDNNLRVIFEGPARKTNHNIKFDIKQVEYQFACTIAQVECDSMILHYLYDENQAQGLKEICDLRYKDLRGYSEELKKIIGMSKVEEGQFADAPLSMIANYGARDSDASCRLREDVSKQLSSATIRFLTHFYMPLTRIYATAELWGVRIDLPYIERVSKELHEKADIESKAIFELAGEEFNINSSKQLIQVLYHKLHLPTINMTKGGSPSTDEKTLKMLGNVPIAKRILNYRGHNKNLTTYVDKMPGISDIYGRIHPSNKLTGTVTGRLSSSAPNIQNIPRDPLIKGIFIPQEDFYLLEIDYSQIELRVMAWYSNDPVMLEEYRTGADIHALNCEMLFDVTKENSDPIKFKRFRKLTKLCNFGGMYGGSAKKLMTSVNEKLEDEDPHLTMDMSQKFIDFFFSKYKGIAQYLRVQEQIIRKDKQAVSCFGRIRHLPNVDSPDQDKRSEAIREGINAVIQSTASDCTQFSIIMSELALRGFEMTWEQYFNTEPLDIWNTLCNPKWAKSRFLFSVHDAQIWEIHKDEVEKIIPLIKRIMLNPPPPFNMVVDAEEKVYKERWGGV
jgi:DNA polymerase-1